jgi:hypothetical protein
MVEDNYSVLWDKLAVYQLAEIYQYIFQDSPQMQNR